MCQKSLRSMLSLATSIVAVVLSQASHALPLYWNLFNIEDESVQSAQFVTYASLTDMLLDANRLDVFTPTATSPFAARNIVGSASDGSTYWNVFNIEDESAQSAQFATYGSLTDMLSDANRLGVFTPTATSPFAARNIVGSGSDGSTYWNVFNIEDENAQSAQFATYGSLTDMLLDANRLGVFTPTATSPFAARNIVGSGAFVNFTQPPVQVPEPPVILLFCLSAVLLLLKRSRTLTGQSTHPGCRPCRR